MFIDVGGLLKSQGHQAVLSLGRRSWPWSYSTESRRNENRIFQAKTTLWPTHGFTLRESTRIHSHLHGLPFGGEILVMLSHPPPGASYVWYEHYVARFCMENNSNTLSTELSTRAEILDVTYQGLKIYPTFSQQWSKTQTTEIFTAPSGLRVPGPRRVRAPGPKRVRGPKIVHNYNTRPLFDTQPRNKTRNVSDNHTEARGLLHALRCCYDAVAADF